MSERKPRKMVVPQPFPGQPFVLRRAAGPGYEVVQFDPLDGGHAVAVYAAGAEECRRWVERAEAALEAGRAIAGLSAEPRPRQEKLLPPKGPAPKKKPGHRAPRVKAAGRQAPPQPRPPRLTSDCDYCGARHVVELHDPLEAPLACEACWDEEATG